MSAVLIRTTATMGRGVFAAQAIRTGDVLAVFPTLRLPADEVARLRAAGTSLANYWFEDDEDGAAFIVLGWIELVNHRLPPNVDRRWHASADGETVTVFALRNIAEGEQLFLDYKFDATATDNPAWA